MCPLNMSVNTDAGSDTATVSFSMSFADNVDNYIDAVCDPPSGHQFPIGETIVSCWVVDSSNNTDNCSFTISVTGKLCKQELNIMKEENPYFTIHYYLEPNTS